MEFKAIENTRYLVSDTGLVYSSVSNKLLKSVDDGRGYLTVTLWVDGTSEKFKIHRLVAKTFLPNPHGLIEVNHKNGNKLDNFVSNLEWVTHAENMKHAWSNNLMKIGSETFNAILTENDVVEIKQLMLKGLNNQEISELFGVARATISKIRDIKTWKHVLPGLILPASSSKFKGGKLDETQIKEIRLLSENGVSNPELANMFKVHNGTIYNIVNRISYKNI
jgi:transposase